MASSQVSSSDIQESGPPVSLSTTPSSASDTDKSQITTESGIHVANPAATSITTPPSHYHAPAIPSPLSHHPGSNTAAHVAQASQTSLSPLPVPQAPSHPPSLSLMPQFSPSPPYIPSNWAPPPQWPSSNYGASTGSGPSSSYYNPPYPYGAPYLSSSGHSSSTSGPASGTSNTPNTNATTGLSPFNSYGHAASISPSATPLSALNENLHSQPSSIAPSSSHPPVPSSPAAPSSGNGSYYNGFLPPPNHTSPLFEYLLPSVLSGAEMTAEGMLNLSEMPGLRRFATRREHSTANVLRFIEGLPEVKKEELDDQHRTCGICWGDYVTIPAPLPLSQ